MAMAVVVKGMQGLSQKLNDTSRIKQPQNDFLSRVAIDIRRKSAENSPVATGNLKNSWAYKINTSRKEATVGTPLGYARPLEFGVRSDGSPYRPRGVGIIPFFEPAVQVVKRDIGRYVKIMGKEIEKEYQRK